MSGLRASLLEQIRILGNHSGCHQRPDRSFFFHGKQFPVCARCTGVTVGELGAVLYGLFGGNLNNKAACFFLGIMGTDWLVQETGLLESTNKRRLITGIFGGFGLFSLYINAGQFIIRKVRS